MFLQNAEELKNKKAFGDRALQTSNTDGDTHAGAEKHMGKCLGSRPQSWLLRLWLSNPVKLEFGTPGLKSPVKNAKACNTKH